jgi:hypothetical protein
MNYYINEYSLRGQFRDVDDFLDSLRRYTLPVLKKIGDDKGNVIWKKDDLWNAKICNNIALNNIPAKRNERSPERAILINRLIKLAYEKPHWNDQDECGIIVKEYRFDEEYREYFHRTNCFIKGLYDEGRIISFFHNSYKNNDLEIVIERENKEIKCLLENIYSIDWWKIETKIQTWYIDKKYKVEIRAKEFNYHPPHFHVSYNEYAAVFTLKSGNLYKCGKKELLQKDLNDIYNWYKDNKNELVNAWNNLHIGA